ncbi:MAG: glycosyltransferase [Candidatus Zixiibacteriota bacterium]|nr:MAG: glycosyltransferase [candidate division Zixibacteria bacterium]
MNAKPRLQVYLKNLSDEKAAEVARRMPFLKKDFKVGITFLGLEERGEGQFADSGIPLTPVHVAPLPPDDLLNSLQAFSETMEEDLPDVVMAALPDPLAAAFLTAAKAAGVPLVVAEFDDHPSLISRLEELTALCFCDKILPATRNLQRAIGKTMPYLAAKADHLLPHSADTTYIQQTKDDRRRLRQNLRVDTEQKMITMIAPFDRRRDHDTLLEACALLKARGHEFILMLVGDGPERHRLTEKIYALRLEDQVAILDDPNDHLEILCATDIFALSTHFEGNNIPLLEAMAQGLAIAATDVDGISDLIRDERSGRLARPKDAESFAQALVDLLAQEKIRKKLGSVARKCIENRGNLNQFMPAFVKRVKGYLKELTEPPPAKAAKGSKAPRKKAAPPPVAPSLKKGKEAEYIQLQMKIRELWKTPAPGFGIQQAADLLDGFPLHTQVDLLEKLCHVQVEHGPLALFVRPLEKVLSDRFYLHLPLLEMRLLEQLAVFYIDLSYHEGVQKLIEQMEEYARTDLFRYHYSTSRFAGLRSHARLAQLHEFTGKTDQRDFYRLEMWEYMRPREEGESVYFHQQNAAYLEGLGEIKLAARELQKDSMGAVQLLGPVAVAHPAPEDRPVATPKVKPRALKVVSQPVPEREAEAAQ